MAARMYQTIGCFGIIFGLLAALVKPGEALLCYQCVSTHPGCGHDFKWIWHKTITCPDEDDVCVKIIENKDEQEVITRDCLSSLKGFRTDIPADHYEGCRSGTVDVKLGHYINNTIKQFDLRRDYYDSTTWCMCYFDNWCNSAPSLGTPIALSAFAFIFVNMYTHFW